MKLIVEMEMPKRCGECDIVQKTKTGYRCPIASKMHGFSCVAGRGQLELPYYCPIHGVLPEQHGDLIDRQKAIFEICEGLVSKTYRHYAKKILESERLLPTIIAAERSEHGTTAD